MRTHQEIAHQQGLAEARETLAGWMEQRSLTTGHGDTLTDLLKELDWQYREALYRAYIRGTEYQRENPDSYGLVQKAAADYADRLTSPPQPPA